MSATVVVFLPRAKREIDDADEWWRANRARPDAVLDAIERFVTLSLAEPHLGAVVPGARVRECRRLLLAEIGYWIYYRVAGARVEVVTRIVATMEAGERRDVGATRRSRPVVA